MLQNGYFFSKISVFWGISDQMNNVNKLLVEDENEQFQQNNERYLVHHSKKGSFWILEKAQPFSRLRLLYYIVLYIKAD